MEQNKICLEENHHNAGESQILRHFSWNRRDSGADNQDPPGFQTNFRFDKKCDQICGKIGIDQSNSETTAELTG
jgi:hypothetical protein